MSRTNRELSVVEGAAGPKPVRETVIVVGDDDALTREVCAHLDAAPWRVQRVADVAETGRSRRPTLVVVVSQDCDSAVPVMGQLVGATRASPIVVVAEDVTTEGRATVLAGGATACVDAEDLRARSWAVVVGCLLEIENLRRRLSDVTEEAQARSRLSRHARSMRDETVNVLRATASGVLLSLQALRTARDVVLSNSAAGVVDSLCASVRSMFDVLDAIETTTPSTGYPVLPAGRDPTPGHGLTRP